MTWNDPRNKHHRWKAISGMFAKCEDCPTHCGPFGKVEPCTSPRAALLRDRTIRRLKRALVRVCGEQNARPWNTAIPTIANHWGALR
jgi:hypothetical protein